MVIRAVLIGLLAGAVALTVAVLVSGWDTWAVVMAAACFVGGVAGQLLRKDSRRPTPARL